MVKLTPEQKRKVPRHLRGARTYRDWCPFCEEWHGYPNMACKNNPRYAEYRERQREGARRWAIENFKVNGAKAHEAAWNKLRYDTEYRRVNRERFLAKVRTDQKGKNNAFYGRRHTLETRLKMSTSLRAVKARLKDVDLEREGIVSPAISSAFDLLRESFPDAPADRDEFSGGEVVATWGNEDTW